MLQMLHRVCYICCTGHEASAASVLLHAQHSFLQSEGPPAADGSVLRSRHGWFVLFEIHQIVDVCRNDRHRLGVVLEAGTWTQTLLVALNEIGVVVALLECRHVDDAGCW